MLKKIRCGIVGYGPVFNWGRMHALRMRAVEEMEVAAFCDAIPERAALARSDFPDVFATTNLDDLLKNDDLDLISIVTPHNVHAALAVACLKAGKHVVVEKPMCLTVAEATAMIDAAKTADRTLAVYHNRRHDGNYRLIQEIVRSGEIGEVFQVEATACGYSPPASAEDPNAPWRGKKAVSGGGLYDWGAHAIDWTLALVPSRIERVTGFFHRFGEDREGNEDQTQVLIKFENGCVGEVHQSRVAFYGRGYLWRILGTKGAILDTGDGAIEGYGERVDGPSGGSLKVRTAEGERIVPYLESDWSTYYRDLAAHLLRSEPVPVSGEDGRRVISVLETAEKSSISGFSESVPFP